MRSADLLKDELEATIRKRVGEKPTPAKLKKAIVEMMTEHVSFTDQIKVERDTSDPNLLLVTLPPQLRRLTLELADGTKIPAVLMKP